MGMAAAQARLLSITSRMSDNELRAQIINNNKMRLATASSKASEAYINALNNATMMITNYDTEGNDQYQKLTFNSLTQYSPYNTQYGLSDINGNLLVNEDEAVLFQQSNDLNDYLEKHGLVYKSTYFDNSSNLFTYDANGKVVIGSDSFDVDELEAMYYGGDYGDITYDSYEVVSQTSIHSDFYTNSSVMVDELAKLKQALSSNESDAYNAMQEGLSDIATTEYYDSVNNTWTTSVIENAQTRVNYEAYNTQWLTNIYNYVGTNFNPSGRFNNGIVNGTQVGGSIGEFMSKNLGNGCYSANGYEYDENAIAANGRIDFADKFTPLYGDTNNMAYAYTCLCQGSNKLFTFDSKIDFNDSSNVREYPLSEGGDILNGYYRSDDGERTDILGFINYGDSDPDNDYILLRGDDANLMAFGVMKNDGSMKMIKYNNNYYLPISCNNHPKGYPQYLLHKIDINSETPVYLRNAGVNDCTSVGSTNIEDGNNYHYYTNIAGCSNMYVGADIAYQVVNSPVVSTTEYGNNTVQPIYYNQIDNKFYYFNMNTRVDAGFTAQYDSNHDDNVFNDAPAFISAASSTSFSDNREVISTLNGLSDWSLNNDLSNSIQLGNNFIITKNNSGNFDIRYKYGTDWIALSLPPNHISINDIPYLLNGIDFNNNPGLNAINTGFTGYYLDANGEPIQAGVDSNNNPVYETYEIPSGTNFSLRLVDGKLQLDFYDAAYTSEDWHDILEQYQNYIIENISNIDYYNFEVNSNNAPASTQQLNYQSAVNNMINFLFSDIPDDVRNYLQINSSRLTDITWLFSDDASIEINGTTYYLRNYLRDETQKLRQLIVLDEMFQTYGAPVWAWVDVNNNNSNADAKAQWYTNLYNRMLTGGYKALEDGLASSNEWIEFALENSIAVIEQVDQTNVWKPTVYSNVVSITEVTDDVAIARAEAEYNKAINNIQAKDKRYDLQLKNIDTEHSALQTEYDQIQRVLHKHIERTFKIFS